MNKEPRGRWRHDITYRSVTVLIWVIEGINIVTVRGHSAPCRPFSNQHVPQLLTACNIVWKAAPNADDCDRHWLGVFASHCRWMIERAAPYFLRVILEDPKACSARLVLLRT